jgi:hypothetical protein
MHYLTHNLFRVKHAIGAAGHIVNLSVMSSFLLHRRFGRVMNVRRKINHFVQSHRLQAGKSPVI